MDKVIEYARRSAFRFAAPYLREQGQSAEEIGSRFGVCARTVRRALAAAGASKPKPEAWTDDDVALLIREMHADDEESDRAVCRRLKTALRREPDAIRQYWMRLDGEKAERVMNGDSKAPE